MQPALLVLVLALVSATLQRLFRSRRRLRGRHGGVERPTIFVCVVAHCDRDWPAAVEQIRSAATHPDRVAVGVVEYVEDADDAVEVAPDAWRGGTVRTYAVSRRIATTERAARVLCCEQLMENEDFVLLSRPFHAVGGWDDELEAMMLEHEKAHGRCSMVLSTRPSRDEQVALFPVVTRSGAVRMRRLCTHASVAVPSLVCLPDLVFARRELLAAVLTASHPLEISAALDERGVATCVPGRPIAVHAALPRTVPPAFKRKHRAHAFAAKIGCDSGRSAVTAHARLGMLDADRPASELVAKFGSVVAARVELQTEQQLDASNVAT